MSLIRFHWGDPPCPIFIETEHGVRTVETLRGMTIGSLFIGMLYYDEYVELTIAQLEVMA